MKPSEIAFLSAVEQAARIRARELSPVEVVEAALGQIDALNPIVNAVVTPLHEQARAAARDAEEAVRRGEPLGPLHGVPIGLKDMTETAGLRTTYGSKLYEDNVPATDALLVTRLKQAGGSSSARPTRPSSRPASTPATRPSGRRSIPGTPTSTPRVERRLGRRAGDRHVRPGRGERPRRLAPQPCFLLQRRRLPRERRSRLSSAWVYDQFSVHGPMARTVRDAALMLSAMAGPRCTGADLDLRAWRAVRPGRRGRREGMASCLDARPRWPVPGRSGGGG